MTVSDVDRSPEQAAREAGLNEVAGTPQLEAARKELFQGTNFAANKPWMF